MPKEKTFSFVNRHTKFGNGTISFPLIIKGAFKQRWVGYKTVQKFRLFVNYYKVDNVNVWGRWSKKS